MIEIRNPDELESWLKNPMGGDVAVYHRGSFTDALDNERFLARGRRNQGPKPLHRFWEALQDAQASGKVHLLQKKLGWSKYEYLAVRRDGRA